MQLEQPQFRIDWKKGKGIDSRSNSQAFRRPPPPMTLVDENDDDIEEDFGGDEVHKDNLGSEEDYEYDSLSYPY